MVALTVICGGQTGADRAALVVAHRRGIPTGGWMPRGFRAEDGRHPDSFGRDWTLENCARLERPYVDIPLPHNGPSRQVVVQAVCGVAIVNVAGHRESVHPGIFAWTQAYLEDLFDELAL